MNAQPGRYSGTVLYGWWLRSPGKNQNNAENVNTGGFLDNSNNVNNDNNSARPAFPICRKSVRANGSQCMGKERNTVPFRRDEGSLR